MESHEAKELYLFSHKVLIVVGAALTMVAAVVCLLCIIEAIEADGVSGLWGRMHFARFMGFAMLGSFASRLMFVAPPKSQVPKGEAPKAEGRTTE
jgi:hypothetical protein